MKHIYNPALLFLCFQGSLHAAQAASPVKLSNHLNALAAPFALNVVDIQSPGSAFHRYQSPLTRSESKESSYSENHYERLIAVNQNLSDHIQNLIVTLQQFSHQLSRYQEMKSFQPNSNRPYAQRRRGRQQARRHARHQRAAQEEQQ